MKKKMLALGAMASLALSAQAQLYNWTLTTQLPGSPGNGSGTLTLTSGVVTAMSGTIGGENVTLLAPGTQLPVATPVVVSLVATDNNLPLNSNGIGLNLPLYGILRLEANWGVQSWVKQNFVSGPATFTYTPVPVPEPSTWAMGGVFGLAAVVTVAARRRQQVAKA
jgi:hypothetical protein